MIQRLLTGIGGVAVALLAAFAALAGWQRGSFDDLTRPRVAAPITVSIHGPRGPLVGDTASYYLQIAGEHGIPEWKVIAPPESSGVEAKIVVAESYGGRVAQFTPAVAGDHILTASVGGPGNIAASAVYRVEAVELAALEPPLQASPIDLLAAAQASQPPALDVAALTAEALAEVETANRAVEARTVAGCIRSVVGRIQTGLIAPDADPVSEVEAQASAALGERIGAWQLFLGDVRAIIGALRDAGQVTTAASAAGPLSEIAGVLQRSH